MLKESEIPPTTTEIIDFYDGGKPWHSGGKFMGYGYKNVVNAPKKEIGNLNIIIQPNPSLETTTQQVNTTPLKEEVAG